MQELDGVFDGHDVFRPHRVDAVDHGGERRRFAGAGDAGDQHQATALFADLLNNFRQI